MKTTMYTAKKIAYTLVIVLFAVLFTGCNENPTLKDLQGNTIKFSSLKGKWVFINYWASWCKPCYKEIPALNAFYQAHKDKVVVLGVSYDQVATNTLKTIVKDIGIQFPTLISDPAVALHLGNVPGLPATYVFAPDGKLKKKLFGIQTEQSLQKIIGTA